VLSLSLFIETDTRPRGRRIRENPNPGSWRDAETLAASQRTRIAADSGAPRPLAAWLR